MLRDGFGDMPPPTRREGTKDKKKPGIGIDEIFSRPQLFDQMNVDQINFEKLM